VSNHGRVLLFLADDPGMRLHDIAARLRITERSAHSIVTDLTAAGYISKQRMAAATATRSWRTSRFQSPLPARRPSGKFLPCSRAQTLASHQRKGDTAEPAASRRACVSGHVSHQAACSAST
jgi:hypothetical protein